MMYMVSAIINSNHSHDDHYNYIIKLNLLPRWMELPWLMVLTPVGEEELPWLMVLTPVGLPWLMVLTPVGEEEAEGATNIDK